MAVLFGVVKADAAERVGVVFTRGSRGQQDSVIGAQAAGGIDGMRVATAKQDAALGAGDEEGATAGEDVETLEVDVSAIHHVEGAGLRHHGASRMLTSCSFPSVTSMNVG